MKISVLLVRLTSMLILSSLFWINYPCVVCWCLCHDEHLSVKSNNIWLLFIVKLIGLNSTFWRLLPLITHSKFALSNISCSFRVIIYLINCKPLWKRDFTFQANVFTNRKECYSKKNVMFPKVDFFALTRLVTELTLYTETIAVGKPIKAKNP